LHAIGADSGWETAVARIGTSVVGIDATPSSSRREGLRETLRGAATANLLFQDAASYRMNNRSFWPQRSATGSSLPLAEAALEVRFPDAAERGQYVTKLSSSSKRVVGLAFEYERLLERQAALRACSYW